MRETVFYCDECKKKIEGYLFSLPIYERMNDGPVCSFMSDSDHMDLCPECTKTRAKRAISVLQEIGMDGTMLRRIEEFIMNHANDRIADVVGPQGIREVSTKKYEAELSGRSGQ